jgi:WD40 repeat protein
MKEVDTQGGGEGDNGGFDVVELRFEKGSSMGIHSKPITAMKLNTQGDILASSSEDGYIKVTNLVNKKEVASIYNQEKISMDIDLHS